MKHQIHNHTFSQADEVKTLFYGYENQLSKYVEQLLWWNEKINLVSRDVSRETVLHHVEHSLVVAVSELFQNATQIIDAGTGGGLPGIPLGIVATEKKVLLNDIVSKKMMACKQMIFKMGLRNVSVQDGSIEAVEIDKGSVIVSKHAFKINDLVGLLGDKNWEGIVLLKGVGEIEEELNGIDLPLKINVFSLDSFQDSFYSGKALVEITKK